jgi:integrase
MDSGNLHFPYLGANAISGIQSPDILAVLRRIETKGLHETAHRAKSRCSQIFRHAVATGRAKRDPTADLRGVLAPVVTKSHAAITDPQAIAQLLRAIDGYTGGESTRAALKLAPMWFVRPCELRMAEWSEFDLDEAIWRIPAERMKMGEAHIVPLADQSIEILRVLHAAAGYSRFVFPSVRSSSRPMSENTVNAALRRLGYSGDEMTGHGFRALASTRLNEMGWAPDLIERQLAHTEQNKVRVVYNRAKYLDERRRMMQAWAGYLDGLKAGGNIVPLHKESGKRG